MTTEARRARVEGEQSTAMKVESEPGQLELQHGPDSSPARLTDAARVVALGGSAGSIGALQKFFQRMPADSGLAFIVVVHLSPAHESSLSDVLQRVTSMPVAPVHGGETVQANHVYVIPPGKHLTLVDARLRLSELPPMTGRRVSIDLLLRTLAESAGANSAAVILSGADGDGALGLKRVKERGGLTIAQDPNQAEHSSMPRAAIATNMVDWVLPVDSIPVRLMSYFASERRLRIPTEAGSNPDLRTSPAAEDDAALRDVLLLLRTRTERDFSHYKRATIVRRVARRMLVNQVENLPAYLAFLHGHPGEVNALLHDLLISVTNFFRDAHAFAALEAEIPKLFRDKGAGDPVRVWVPGCATGEEAYSIAMLLSEHASKLESAPAVQVFATDLDDDVIAIGRQGTYSEAISLDVSCERLGRFFLKEHAGYRLRREIRELVIFAVHDVLTDSPFSRLSLVSCRNLLIYVNREAQKRVFDTFHFALRPNGRLFLGASETIADDSRLFVPVDKRHRLYARVGDIHASMPLPSGPGTLARALALRDREASRLPGDVVEDSREIAPTPAPALRSHSASAATGDLHLRLIERVAPPSLVVDAEHEIVHLSERAGEFLKFTGGEPNMNLLHAVHPSLRSEVRSLLFRAGQTGELAAASATLLLEDGKQRAVDVRVLPANDLATGYLLVVFDAGAVESAETPPSMGDRDEPVIRHLEHQLERSRRHFHDLVEQHDVSTQELKASNEELQSMIEELRSATEELETGREELQSVNEELTMVNQELKAKVDELGHTNSDLHNLMGATAIPTVFLDRDQRIMRFTPSAVDLFNLISTDIGRPLADLQHRLVYPELLTDADRVLAQLVPVERGVSDHRQRYFMARILPYRTTDNHIAGVVLTFVDVTERQHAEAMVRRANEHLEARVQERTAELDAVNQALLLEIAQHRDVEKRRQELQVRLINAQEEERKRISREFHDEVGQQLAALMLSLKALEAAPPGHEAAAQLRSLRQTAQTAAHEIHLLATRLRPSSLDDLGLSAALGAHVEAWSAQSGVVVDFFSAGIEEPRLPNDIETTLFRIVQEAMTNITKHAQAQRVSVSIERRGDQVLGIVEDDGGGFDTEISMDPSRIGIPGMRERVELVGGEFTISSSPGHGATVRVRIPLRSE